MTKEYILDFLTTHKKEMEETYANGTANDKSDIDIIVDMPPSFDTFFDLKDFLELNLKKHTDLGLEKSMRPFIKNSIKNDIIYV